MRHSASLANWQALSDQLPESCLRIGHGRREPRNGVEVDLDVSGTRLRVNVTHLGVFGAGRGLEVRQLLDGPRKTPPHQGVVVLGDINEWLPLSRPLRWMNSLL